MKQITLNLAHYQAIQAEQGSMIAVNAMRSDIQNHVSWPIAIELNGPNPNGDKVASLSFVRAAAWKPEANKFRVNLLTCGFASDDQHAIADLFNALTNPQAPALVQPKPKEPFSDTDALEDEPEKIVLIVGSYAAPEAIIQFK